MSLLQRRTNTAASLQLPAPSHCAPWHFLFSGLYAFSWISHITTWLGYCSLIVYLLLVVRVKGRGQSLLVCNFSTFISHFQRISHQVTLQVNIYTSTIFFSIPLRTIKFYITINWFPFLRSLFFLPLTQGQARGLHQYWLFQVFPLTHKELIWRGDPLCPVQVLPSHSSSYWWQDLDTAGEESDKGNSIKGFL